MRLADEHDGVQPPGHYREPKDVPTFRPCAASDGFTGQSASQGPLRALMGWPAFGLCHIGWGGGAAKSSGLYCSAADTLYSRLVAYLDVRPARRDMPWGV